MSPGGRILLTGASGILGQALLKLLPAESLICLVHSSQLPESPVEQVQGDILKPELGLAPSEYAGLVSRVQCVIHAAAETNFSEREDSIFRINVDGTRNVAALAREAGATLYHVSTAFVRLVDRPEPGMRANAYARSKAEAEEAVRESGAAHVVVRPSRIIGDSRTGAIARFQGFHFLFDLLLRAESLPSAAPAAARVDFVPVDSVARAIVALLEGGSQAGAYWLTAGERALTLARTIDLALGHIARLTGRSVAAPERVDEWTFQEEVRPQLLAALPAELRPMLDGVFQMMESLNLEPFASSFEQLAAEAGIPPPPDPETTLLRNLQYWARKRGLVRLAMPGSQPRGAGTAS